ncbi:hypothetical protein CCYA_CCYA09G2634 [Cyanidiococcus yangmingshanensis]|nr:hypothetical protein CCYA_CCYA09G2634 [Cyanidiococcus yangmingshanensis]
MHVPILIQSKSLPEWSLLELQGVLSLDSSVSDGGASDAVVGPRLLGTLQRDGDDGQECVLTLVQYELHGATEKLPTPLLVLRKRGPDEAHPGTWWECVALVREKVVFVNRPRPRVPVMGKELKRWRT